MRSVIIIPLCLLLLPISFFYLVVIIVMISMSLLPMSSSLPSHIIAMLLRGTRKNTLCSQCDAM